MINRKLVDLQYAPSSAAKQSKATVSSTASSDDQQVAVDSNGCLSVPLSAQIDEAADILRDFSMGDSRVVCTHGNKKRKYGSDLDGRDIEECLNQLRL